MTDWNDPEVITLVRRHVEHFGEVIAASPLARAALDVIRLRGELHRAEREYRRLLSEY